MTKFILLFVCIAVFMFILIYVMESKDRRALGSNILRWAIPLIVATSVVAGLLFVTLNTTTKVI